MDGLELRKMKTLVQKSCNFLPIDSILNLSLYISIVLFKLP